jgi:hypothetical protein
MAVAWEFGRLIRTFDQRRYRALRRFDKHLNLWLTPHQRIGFCSS